VTYFPDTEVKSRRDFCTACARSAALIAVGSLAACGGSPTSPSGSGSALNTVSATVSGRVVTVPIGSGTALATTGAMAMTQTSLGTFLLTRTSDSSVTVLTAMCTHENTTITRASGSQFVCQNHGAMFTTTGAVAKGPANRALQQFPSQVADNVLTFTA
jgi:cytochrome b6-f complex iron-sulfur subunit